MATPVIKIKRKTTGGTPSSLFEGELAADIANQRLYIGNSSGSPVLIGSAAAGTGTVTSVGLSLPNIFTVTVSSVTTSGTLTASLATQGAKTFFAGPASGNALPTFRAISADDLASNASTNTYLKYNGTGLEWATVASGGTVTSVGLSLPNIFTTGSSVTTSGTLTASLVTQAANTFFAGPLSGTAAPTFRSLVAADLATGPSTNTYLKYNGSALQWATVSGSGGSPAGSTGSIQINNSGVFDSVNDFTHQSTTLDSGNIYRNIFKIPARTQWAVSPSLKDFYTFSTKNHTSLIYYDKIYSGSLTQTLSSLPSADSDTETDTFAIPSSEATPCAVETITSAVVTTVQGHNITLSPGAGANYYDPEPYYLKIPSLRDLGLIVGDRIKFTTSFGNPDAKTSPFGTEMGIEADVWYTIGLISSITDDFVYVLYKNDTLVRIFPEANNITCDITIDYGNYKPLKLYAYSPATIRKLSTKVISKVTVKAATTASTTSLNTALSGSGVTYNNGTNGVGAYLEKSTNGALPTIDSVTLVANDIILVKNFTQNSQIYNGIYTVTSVGGTSSKWRLTRHTSYDTQAELVVGDNTRFRIESGGQATTQSDWKLSSSLTFAVGNASALIQFTTDTSLAPTTTDIPHGLEDGDMIVLYNQTSIFNASSYAKYYSGPSIDGTTLTVPRTYHIINADSSSGSFDIANTDGGTVLSVSTLGDNISTNPTFTFFRRMPKVYLQEYGYNYRGVSSDLTNCELKSTNCSYDLGITRQCITHNYESNKNYLLVTNGLFLNNGSQFYISNNMVDEYSKNDVSRHVPGGKLFKISDLSYNYDWGGNYYDPYYQTDIRTVPSGQNNRVGNYAKFYIKNIDDTYYGLSNGAEISRGGMVFPYNSVYYNSIQYTNYYIFPKLKYLKLKNNPKVVKIIQKTVGSDTFYGVIFDQYIRFDPEYSEIRYFKFYKNQTIIPKSQYILNFDLDNLDILTADVFSENYREFGMYVTTNTKLVLGRSNPAYGSIITSTTKNNLDLNTISPVLVDDNNAGMILKRDEILYNPLINNATQDANFKMYLSLGTSYTENVFESNVQYNNVLWVLGAFGETIDTICESGNACGYTRPPSIANPNSYLRWVKLDYFEISRGAQLTGGSGITVIQPESFAPNSSRQITLADEVPINTSLTVPLIKGTQGGDLNITLESPENNINIVIPQSNTDVALSSGSIYITSGLDAGDVYVQSAEDIYLTSQNVRISGNLIVDGYIESGTGFQGDNTDAEEPIIGLVMDGGTF